MSTKTSRTAPGTEAAATEWAPWTLFNDLGRQQLALLTKTTALMLHGSEAIRKIQQHVAHHASARHEAVAQKLNEPCEPADLLALQAELLRFDVQGAAEYWQQLAGAALKAQVEMMGCASHMFDAGTGGALKPVFEAWQNTLSASQNGAANASATR